MPMWPTVRRALLLLHLQNEVADQNGYIGSQGVAEIVQAHGVLDAAGVARDDFAAESAPIFHVVYARPDGENAIWSTAPALRNPPDTAFRAGSWGVQPVPTLLGAGDSVVTHHTMSAFAGTSLSDELRTRSVTAVLLAGISTHLVVAATAFAASDAGFHVEVLADACAAPTQILHNAGLAMAGAVGVLR